MHNHNCPWSASAFDECDAKVTLLLQLQGSSSFTIIKQLIQSKHYTTFLYLIYFFFFFFNTHNFRFFRITNKNM